MPAWTARPPRTVPDRFPRFGLLPQCEVHGVVFSGVHLDTHPGLHLFETPSGEGTVGGKLFHREKDVSFHLIGHTLFHQGSDEGDDFRDVVGRPWFVIRWSHAQSLHVLLKFPDVSFGQQSGCYPFFPGPVDDLVVHIGEVADIRDLIAFIPEIADDGVEDDHGSGVADMAAVIDGDAADIDPYPRGG